MVFINPWAYYQIHEPDKIPDLNPHNDEEAMGCLAGACGAIIASIIYVLIFYLCFTLTKGVLRPILVMIDSTVIYPILIIYLMKLSFKISDKFMKNKKNKGYER